MVKHAEHYTKRALTKFLNDFIAEGKMFMHNDVVLLAIIIEAVIDELGIVASHQHHGAGAAPACLGASLFAILLFPFDHIEKIDSLKFKDLCLLNVPK